MKRQGARVDGVIMRPGMALKPGPGGYIELRDWGVHKGCIEKGEHVKLVGPLATGPLDQTYGSFDLEDDLFEV